MQDYQYLDSGNGRKLERFGPFTFDRPCGQAIWSPKLQKELWDKACAEYQRKPIAKWTRRKKIPLTWDVKLKNIMLKLSLTDFGHLGVFPEHSQLWDWIEQQISKRSQLKVLNLFGYSGATTLFAAKCGAHVCHLDASKAVVQRARENAALNGLEKHPIRWIVEDVLKFLKREIKRGNTYDAIIMDPPSFGRGSKGEVFKSEEHLKLLMSLLPEVLSENPAFIIVTSHTPQVTPLCLHNLMEEFLAEGDIEVGELSIENKAQILPCGVYGKWFRS